MPRRIVAVFLVAAAFAGTPEKPSPAKPVSTEKHDSVPVVAEAPADLPFTLQSIFGSGDSCEAGFRDKASGKSQWVAPGATYAGWKLESADVKTGRAVLARDGRRIALRLAGEMPKEWVEEEPEEDDSVGEQPGDEPGKGTLLERRGQELMKKNPELQARIEVLGKGIEADMKRRHPELFEGEEKSPNPKAIGLMIGELNDALGRETISGAKELSEMTGAMSDAFKANPYPENADDKMKRNYETRIQTEADRLWRQRTGPAK